MRNAFWSEDRKLLVFWVPKSACGAVAQWFGMGVLGHKVDEFIHAVGQGPDVRKWLRQNGYAHSPETALRLLRDEAEHSIAFVRHPFDRLVSAFANKFVVIEQRPIDSFDKLDKWAQCFYCQVRSLNQQQAARNYRGLTFQEFLSAITALSEAAGKEEPELNPHINRQYPVLFARDRLVAKEIVDIQNLNSRLLEVNARLGLSFLPPYRNVTPYEEGDQSITDVPSVDLALGRAALSRRGLASPETIAMSHRAHSLDYEAFGFPATPRWVEQGV